MKKSKPYTIIIICKKNKKGNIINLKIRKMVKVIIFKNRLYLRFIYILDFIGLCIFKI